MSQFLNNLPPPPRSRSSYSSSAASGRQPLASSSIVVPTLADVVAPSPDGVGSLPRVSSHGRRVLEDDVPHLESLKLAP